MTARTRPVAAVAALCALTWLGACVSGDDVTSALASYCGIADGKAVCDSDMECCPGFGCSSGVCRAIVAGACFVPDGGQTAGAACGCAADCASGHCTNSTCQ